MQIFDENGWGLKSNINRKAQIEITGRSVSQGSE